MVKEYKLATEPLKLTFKGLGTFRQDVLFARIEDGPSKHRLRNMAGMYVLNVQFTYELKSIRVHLAVTDPEEVHGVRSMEPPFQAHQTYRTTGLSLSLF